MRASQSKSLTWTPAIVFCLIIVNSAFSDEGYPHREKYPDIKVISTEDLEKQYNDVLIVDVRSDMEFDVVRIKKAVHIPISSRNFESNLIIKLFFQKSRSVRYFKSKR